MKQESIPSVLLYPSVGQTFHDQKDLHIDKSLDFLRRSQREGFGLAPRVYIPTFLELNGKKLFIQGNPENGGYSSPSKIIEFPKAKTEPDNVESVDPDKWKENHPDQGIKPEPNPGTKDTEINPVIHTNPQDDIYWLFWVKKHAVLIILLLVVLIIIVMASKN
ncbi:MAG: hypothetical protein PHX80_05485 [Candidatus Nanoarchaeia archaeon]|nr:hypothetical protein [Candidatus Nanoarchaeia archaeon]